MSIWIAIVITAVVTYLISLAVRAATSHEKKINHRIEHLYAISDDQFLRSMGSLLQPNLEGGNTVAIYNNGDEIFPPMLASIAAAQRTITFETFIYWSGAIGRRFAEALAERARAGVRVYVVIDWFGSTRMDPGVIQMLEDSGVEIERYHPIRWYSMRRLNNRTHRKILVIDGRVGFTGGVGIADQWLGDARNKDEWRDVHFRIEGPAVSQLQRAFMDNWLKGHSRVLHGDDYFPHLEEQGDVAAQIFMSSPSEGSESARLMFLLSIASAARSLRIATAYFVPDTLTVKILAAAAERGVRVRIIVPGAHIDKSIVRRASRARWGKLLEAGIEIYEYQTTMYHCKMMIADNLWLSVGSANFDNRSFRLNDEANLNVYNAEVASRLADDFDQDLTRARRVTFEEWKSRPLRERAYEHALALLRPVL
jgi:cardiolipin synthase